MSSSQPLTVGRAELGDAEYSQLTEEPSMSQFTANHHLPESLVDCSKSNLTLDATRIPLQGPLSARATHTIPFAPSPPRVAR
jgi:hypothetical protein